MADPNNNPQFANGSSLPQGLRNGESIAIIRNVIKQWSQLVAWSWTSSVAFQDDETKKAEEQELKKYFKLTIEQQAQYQMAANEYGDPQAAKFAQQKSEILKDIVTGKKSPDGVTLTLPKVYQKLTDNSSYYMFDKEFMVPFRYEVTINSFVGSIRDDETGQATYVSTLAYPPRPVLGENTVTEPELDNWMRNQDSGDYFPPSVYIPLACS